MREKTEATDCYVTVFISLPIHEHVKDNKIPSATLAASAWKQPH